MDFDELKRGILNCTDCEERFGFKPVPVFYGSSKVKIFHISQAPSKTVSNTHLPFSDQTGKKLKGLWYQITDEIFYNQNNFYITSIAHCYPGKNKSRGDRTPPVYCAKKWLGKEMALVENEIYVIVGGYAAKFIFPNEDFNKLIFKDSKINGKPAYVIPHPSPLNIKWFKDHPEFEEKRLPQIRAAVQSSLGIS